MEALVGGGIAEAVALVILLCKAGRQVMQCKPVRQHAGVTFVSELQDGEMVEAETQ